MLLWSVVYVSGQVTSLYRIPGVGGLTRSQVAMNWDSLVPVKFIVKGAKQMLLRSGDLFFL